MFHVDPLTILVSVEAIGMIAFAFGWLDACRRWRKNVEDLGRELEQHGTMIGQQQEAIAAGAARERTLTEAQGAYWHHGYAHGQQAGRSEAFEEMSRVVEERSGVEIAGPDIVEARKRLVH